jgi:AcrR family transcriptional regulator
MSTTEAPSAVSTTAPANGSDARTAPDSTGPHPEPAPAEIGTAELGPTAEFAPAAESAPEGPAPVPAASAALTPTALASPTAPPSAAPAAPSSPGTASQEGGSGLSTRVGPAPASILQPATSAEPTPAGPAPTAPTTPAPAAAAPATAPATAPAGAPAPAVSPARTRRPMRADARRNYDRLLAAADAAFTQHGAEASLEDIARRAAVGIGTLYRHFPTRQILLEATFGGRLDALRDEADALAAAAAPMPALTTWLRSLLRYVTEFRGLSELVMTTMRNRASDLHASGAGMRRAGGRLLSRAQATGEVRPELDDADLILMVNGIVWAAERVPGEDHAERLLSVMIDGLRPGRIAPA